MRLLWEFQVLCPKTYLPFSSHSSPPCVNRINYKLLTTLERRTKEAMIAKLDHNEG